LITIKECQKEELDVLFKIAIQTYNDTYKYLWSDKGVWYLEEFYKKENFEQELSQPDIFYFLVYDNDKAIGYFKLKNGALEPYPDTQCIEIDKLYFLKKYVGKGIGKTVMEFIFSFAEKQQSNLLWLKVMESSLAKYFYEKHGFTETQKSYLDYSAMLPEYRWILTMTNHCNVI
jgi:GNAT superfamily N-acetyltransferase